MVADQRIDDLDVLDRYMKFFSCFNLLYISDDYNFPLRVLLIVVSFYASTGATYSEFRDSGVLVYNVL
jgi:hypothetical protein